MIFGSVFNFSSEEIQTLRNKYTNVIIEKAEKENFSKQGKQKIKVDTKEFTTDAYILTLTKEKLNDIYLRMLEELKKDEIILEKIDNLEEILNQYEINLKLRNTFVQEIDELSTQISQNNIGQEKCTVTLYEIEKTPLRIELKGPTYGIEIDIINSQEKDFLRIYNKNLTNQNEKLLVYRNDNDGKYINRRTTENAKTKNYTLKINEVVNDNIGDRKINATFEDGVNKVEAIIQQNVETIEEVEDKVTVSEENAINLSNLESEQLKNVLNTVTTQVSEKMKGITEVVDNDDLRRILEIIGVVKEKTTIESQGITEIEKNRFNSKFTILEGENLDNVAILNLINAIKDNLINLEVISNQQIRLKLDRLNNDEKMVTTFTEYVEKNKNEKYDAKVEYDKNGLARDILLTVVEKKK